MWMMGYNEDHLAEYSYTNNGTRKLRPLVPRPPPPPSTSSCNRFHHDPIINHHHLVAGAGGEQNNKREFNSQQLVVVSSRWNPTPEQLQTLEELYRGGTRTPSAEEIQHITAQLRRYGKIEGKNVFYWFQNHKARERQKRRRQSTHHRNEDSELVEETRNWAIPTFSEKKSMVGERTRKADDEGWMIPVEQEEEEEEEGENDDEVHRRRKSFPATWSQITIINSASSSPLHHRHDDVDCCYETLELFPVNSKVGGEQPGGKGLVPTNNDVSLSPRQFIEFLPLKN